MKASKFVALASIVAITALAVGAAINLPDGRDVENARAADTPAPVSTASLDPVVVTAKR